MLKGSAMGFRKSYLKFLLDIGSIWSDCAKISATISYQH